MDGMYNKSLNSIDILLFKNSNNAFNCRTFLWNSKIVTMEIYINKTTMNHISLKMPEMIRMVTIMKNGDNDHRNENFFTKVVIV